MSKRTGKTKTQLMAELEALNRRVVELEVSKAEQMQPDGVLRQSELRYQHIIQTLTDYIYTVRIEDGQVVETIHGPACIAVTGYTSEDFAADPDLWLQMVHEQDRPAVLDQTRQLLGGKDAAPLEHRIMRKDGARRWVRNTPALHFNAQGNLVAYDGLIQDITDRKRAEDELKEREIRYRTIVENINDALYIHDFDGNIHDVNESACRMLGYKREELIGAHISKIDTPENARLLQGRMNELIENGSLLFDGEHVSKSGKRIPVQVSAKLVSTEGKGTIQGFVRDISERKQAEEALAQERNLLRTLVDSMPDHIYAKDIDGRFTLKNEADARFMGAGSPADAIGKTDFDYYPREYAERFRRDDEEVMFGEAPSINCEAENVDGQGNKHWILATKVPLRDSQGNVIGLVGVGRDITDRKRAEEALRASEEKYRLLFKSNPVPMWVYDTETFAFLAVNDFAVDHYGYSQEEFLSMTLSDIRPPRDVPYLYKVLSEQSGEIRKVDAIRHRKKDGSLIDVEITGHEIEFEGRRAMLVLAMDVTERKRAENLIRAQRDLALALGAASDLEKGLRLCLATALRLSGMGSGGVYRVDEVSGSLELIIHQGLSSTFVESISHYEADSLNAQLVMAGKSVYTEQGQLDTLLDDIRSQENLHGLAIIPIHHEDAVIGCLNVASHSVTEVPAFARDALEVIAGQMGDVIVHMKAEAELQRYRDHLEELVGQRTAELKSANDQLLVLTRAKDEFVSNVSHELRTPISSLKLRQHLLKHHPDQLDEHLHAIQRETERLARTIEDLLQLSRLDQRRMEFRPVAIDLNELASQYVTDRLPIARDAGLDLGFQGEPDISTIWADAGLVGQALSILLTNAISYTPRGGRVLVCTHACYDAGRRWVGFSVSDTGPGVSEEERPQLFERFFRGRVARKSGVPGTGLGLPIAQEIINRHGGSIEVESDGVPGHGATFRVWIPIAEKLNEQPANS